MVKYRDYYWDNVKLVLIFLVVLGHFILPVRKEDTCIDALYYWIYLFHMPAFVFVSGYFSKNYVRKSGKKYKLMGYLTLYLLFTVCLWIIKYALTHKIKWTSLFVTSSAQWYMLGMFVWLLIIPYVAKVSFKVAMCVSMAAALLAGMVPVIGSFLALSRVIVFFPFFLLGYHYKGEYFQKCRPRIKVLSAVILILIFVFLYFHGSSLDKYLKIMYGRTPYSKLGFTAVQGILLRMVWYCVSALMSAALLCIVPNRQLKITYMGARTIGIYFGHRLIRDVFRNLHLYKYMGSGKVLLLSCILVSIAVVYITSASILTESLNRLFYLNLIMKHERKGGAKKKDR